MLFQKRFHVGLVDGSITLSFRRWERPQVKAGGRYRCHPIGVLMVDDVRPVTVDEIGDDDAGRAGFESLEELIAYMRSGREAPLLADTTVFRVEFHYAGDEDARPTAFSEELSDHEVETLSKRLQAMDAASPSGPWTWQALDMIVAHPHRRAGDLAEMLGRERLDFKKDVRRLKALGLTVSHEIGYSISVRGAAFMRLAKRPAKRRRKSTKK